MSAGQEQIEQALALLAEASIEDLEAIDRRLRAEYEWLDAQHRLYRLAMARRREQTTITSETNAPSRLVSEGRRLT